MDIKSGMGYPSAKLSNFSPHKFILDDVLCYSMEGFLQSLKFSNPEVQVEICKLIGIAAKKAGSKKDWRKKQMLYWKGKEYPRKSQEYQDLLDRAYAALVEQSESFRKALLSTQNAVLTHSIGRTKESETILTRREFCSRLTKMRENFKNK